MTNFQLEPTQTDIPIYPRSLVGAFADPCSARKRQLFPILWTSVTLIRLENKSPVSNCIYNKLFGDFQSDWIPLAPYYVNGWQDNGPSLYRKIGNCYLVKLSARNGNYETDLDICRNLPFSGSGICVNCFYNVNPDGNGIQVSGNKLFIVRKPTVSMDTIFANFIVGPDV